MNEKKYPQAIELLSQSIESSPQDYALYPLLAAAYAGRARLDFVSILFSLENSGEEQSTTAFGKMKGFLPSDYSDAEIEDLKAAVLLLDAIPQAYKDANTDVKNSVQLQKFLYNLLIATMVFYKFIVEGENGEIDLEALLSMSEEDAVLIITSLAATTGLFNEGLLSDIDAASQQNLADIQSQNGATIKDKLIAFAAPDAAT